MTIPNTAPVDVDHVTGEQLGHLGPLAIKLARIASQIKRVAKDGHNDFHRYDYATESAILSALRDLQAAEKIVIVPAVIPESITQIPVGEKGEILTSLVCGFTVIDGDSGAQIYATFPGAGTDKLDKGCYKAMTGASKYFLQKLYQIPTGDDPEQSTDAERTGARRTNTARPPNSARPLGQVTPTPAAAAQAPAQTTTGNGNTRTSGPRPLAAQAPASVPTPAAPAAPASQPVATHQSAMPESWRKQPMVVGELPAMSAPVVTIREVVKRSEGTHPRRGAYVAFAVFTEEGQRLGAIDEGGVLIGSTLFDAWKAGRTKVSLKIADTQIGPKVVGVRVL
jgi:ERF superfamily protein